MRILILSCGTGGGHNATGRAMAQIVASHGGQALFPDYLTWAGNRVARVVDNAYIGTVRHAPRLFGQVYHLGMAVSRHWKRSPVYYANSRMAGYLQDYLRQHPVDAIVMPHLYPAETVTWLRRKGMKLPLTVAIATDYTCVPFWEETDCDYYVLPAPELMDDFAGRGIPRDKLLPLGIPVSRECELPLTRQQACERLGLDSQETFIMAMGGSMGAGDMLELVQCLIRQTRTEKIIAVAGGNARVLQSLTQLNCPRLSVISRTAQVPLYLRACSLLFTKPGGLTSTEAAVCQIPMVHTAPIPGCETENQRYFATRGMSVTAATAEGQVRAGLDLLHSPQAADQMRLCQRQHIPAGAAERIYRMLLSKI